MAILHRLRLLRLSSKPNRTLKIARSLTRHTLTGRTSLILLLLTSTLIPLSGCSPHALYFWGSSSYVELAEEAAAKDQIPEAIELYRQHIQRRLAATSRPAWENPNFYLISIADLQLKKDQVAEAIATIREAEAAQVDRNLISDRYRQVAEHHEKKGELAKAMELLKEKRELDPLIYDNYLDRLAKEITEREAKAGAVGK